MNTNLRYKDDRAATAAKIAAGNGRHEGPAEPQIGPPLRPKCGGADADQSTRQRVRWPNLAARRNRRNLSANSRKKAWRTLQTDAIKFHRQPAAETKESLHPPLRSSFCRQAE